MDVNLPEVHAEMTATFARYEAALVGNDVDGLDALFWPSAFTVRYGAGENLVGIDAIRRFRAERPSAGLARTLRHTIVTTFGHAFATTMTEFVRPAFEYDGQLARVGRQSQSWVRFAEGWRVVAAHVSVLALPVPEPLSLPEPNRQPIQPGG
jgi:hypothetical protein